MEQGSQPNNPAPGTDPGKSANSPAPAQPGLPAAGGNAPRPHEGGQAPGPMPPLGSAQDLGAPAAAPVTATTPTVPTPGTAPADQPASPSTPGPGTQAGATGAATAPAPAVLGSETTSPPPALTTGTPATPPAPGAPTAAGTLAAAAVGTGQGHSASASAAEAAAADQARPLPAGVATESPAAPAPEAAAAGTRAAALIREQIVPLTLRIAYDTQQLLQVGAEGPSPETIRTILETFAAAIERGDAQTFAYTYSRAARPIIPQINDQVLPFRLGLQISGMFEGVLRDAFEEGFASDPALRAASVQLLEQLAAPAKRSLLGEPRELVQWQAPRI